jgi:hypothetical protein
MSLLETLCGIDWPAKDEHGKSNIFASKQKGELSALFGGFSDNPYFNAKGNYKTR